MRGDLWVVATGAHCGAWRILRPFTSRRSGSSGSQIFEAKDRVVIAARGALFSLNPEPGDPWIAGGATDDYVGGAIGVAISPR